MKAMLIAALLAATPTARTIEMKVTDKGFAPNRIEGKKGEPLHFVVIRKTEATCAKALAIPDANLQKDLPLGKPVAFDFTPSRSGQMTYVCGMGIDQRDFDRPIRADATVRGDQPASA